MAAAEGDEGKTVYLRFSSFNAGQKNKSLAQMWLFQFTSARTATSGTAENSFYGRPLRASNGCLDVLVCSLCMQCFLVIPG